MNQRDVKLSEEVKVRPIIFSGPMVRALLEGRKTQTRRLVKEQPDGSLPPLRYGLGDLLWVREAHYVNSAGYKDGTGKSIWYRATDPNAPTTWTPSIHMPRWASRLTLEVTGVKIERLQDISEQDAKAEGVEATEFNRKDHPLSICFAVLWDSIHGNDAWRANPWVVAITFTVHKQNVDALLSDTKEQGDG